MATHTVRTTIALPAELLAAVDQAVQAGKARSRHELVTRHSVVSWQRNSGRPLMQPLQRCPKTRPTKQRLKTSAPSLPPWIGKPGAWLRDHRETGRGLRCTPRPD